MSNFIDLKGKTIGDLFIIEKDPEATKSHRGGIYWKTRCSCGRYKSIRACSLNEGKTTSCGECKNDLTGQKFGRLTVIKRSRVNKHQQWAWWCKCDCGNICEALATNLKRGSKVSCGCYRREKTHQVTFRDLTGQKFNMLTPLSWYRKDNHTYWHCLCECGNTTEVRSANLVSNRVHSCGCLSASIGESNIEKILKEACIDFVPQYKVKELPRKRFDFYLPAYNRIIEFDGPQHYTDKGVWKGYNLKAAQQRDAEKNEYAWTHKIDLVRIPYEKRDKIILEDLLGNSFLYKEETEAPDMEEAQELIESSEEI